MNRRPLFSALVTVLCFIALLGAQALGGVRGYISDCGGIQEWTVLDPCTQEGEDGPCDHEQVREDVQVRLLPALVAPVLVPVLIAVLDSESESALSSSFSSHMALGEGSAGPPPGVAVARTIVLLI